MLGVRGRKYHGIDDTHTLTHTSLDTHTHTHRECTCAHQDHRSSGPSDNTDSCRAEGGPVEQSLSLQQSEEERVDRDHHQKHLGK